MIPHKIHYFWFGGGTKPKSVIKCIESWRKFCPDFDIIEWNETNYDIHKHPFMEKAYQEKRWAFVSDYARLDILYNNGGIYLDTDVEVLKDLSPLCENEAFIGFESTDAVNDGQGFGCAPGLEIFKQMLDVYDSDDVYCFWGGEKQYVESPKLRTIVLVGNGLKLDGTRQTVEGVEIYPVDYFCPKNYKTGVITVTNNTYSIHHFDGSWHEGKSAGFYLSLMRGLNRTFGEDKGKKIYEGLMNFKDNLKKSL